MLDVNRHAGYDKVMATSIKRSHEPPGIVGDLLQAEVAEKQERSIKYQISTAKLPLAEDIEDFEFDGTPFNEALVRDLAGRGFIATQRNTCWWAAPVPARAIWRLPLRARASEPGQYLP